MNKRYMLTSLILILLTVILSWKYPDVTPLGEKMLSALGLPTWSNDHSGHNYLGIFIVLSFIAGLLFLRISLDKHQRKIVLAVAIVVLWIPSHLITSYQTFFAKGIYTLEYERNGSTCTYKREDQWMTGKCSMTFTNHGPNVVQFAVSIRNEHIPATSFLETLDVIGDQTVYIHSHEKKTISVDFKKWVENVETPQNGTSSGLDITVKSETSQRNL